MKVRFVSIKMYNAYIFDKQYSMVELENLMSKLKERFRKEGNKYYHTKIVNEFLYYYYFSKLHTEEQIRKINYGSLLLEKKYFKICSEINSSFWKNDCSSFSADELNASIQIIPYKDNLLAISFITNYEAYQTLIDTLPYLKDYHYQNQTDKPKEVSSEEWKEREETWNEVFKKDDLLTHHGFNVSLFDVKTDLNFKFYNHEKPNYDWIFKELAQTYDDPNAPKDEKNYIHYTFSKQGEKWLNNKAEELKSRVSLLNTDEIYKLIFSKVSIELS